MFRRICTIATQASAATMLHRTPSQIAWGIAFGLSLGLIPKDNLLSALLLASILLFRINHLAASLFVVLGWLASGIVVNVSHPVGQWLLSQSLVTQTLSGLYQFPFAPWLRLNNTLVMGGFAAGLISLVPSYLVSKFIVVRAKKRIAELAIEQIASDATNYRKSVTEQSRQRTMLSNALPLSDTSNDRRDTVEIATTQAMANADDDQVTTADQLAVADQLQIEQLDAPAAVQSKDHRWLESVETPNTPNVPVVQLDQVVTAGSDTVLRETIIEVVRYKRPRKDRNHKPQEMLCPLRMHRFQRAWMPQSLNQRLRSRPNRSNQLKWLARLAIR
jgi:uncharacterized protein (TIGR03546 family)